MATTRSQTGKSPQKNGKKVLSAVVNTKSKPVKVTKLAKSAKKLEKPKTAGKNANGKRQGGIDDPLQLYSQELSAENNPQRGEGEPKMPEIPSSLNPFVKYLQFPPAKTLGQHDWPKISFGELAPKPRWRVCPTTTDPKAFDNDTTQDLIQKAKGKWELKGVRPTDSPKFDPKIHKPPLSYDANVGLGAFDWTFEEGDASAWNGLNRDQLHEYAFRCLWEAIQCAPYLRQIEDDIRRGFYRDAVKHTLVRIPPLPKPPKEGNFPGHENNLVEKVPLPTTRPTWHFANSNDGYERRNTALRPDVPDKGLHPMTKRMIEYKRKVIRDAPDLPRDYDDTSSEDEGDDRHEGESAGPGKAPAGPGGDGSSEPTVPMDIDVPEGPAREQNSHGGQEGPPEERRLVGGKAKQPVADDKESAGPASEDQDEATIPAHLYDLHNMDSHDAASFYRACKEICNDPKRRRKYFPVANAVRRIRTWAGSELPEDVGKIVKSQLPPSFAMKRRFGSFKSTLDAPGEESIPGPTRKKQCTLSGRVIKSGRSNAGTGNKKK